VDEKDLGTDVAVRVVPNGAGVHDVELTAGAADGGTVVRARLGLPPGMELAVESTPISDRYGRRALRACLVARGSVALPTHVTLTIG